MVTCTRGRAQHIGRLLESIHESTHPDFEHLVVDQSLDSTTREIILAAAARDRRIHYLHRAEPGKSKAMNMAIRQSTGEILAFTDDDCEPRRNWLAVLARLFHQSTADIICGKVSGAPHDPSRGYVCQFDPGYPHVVTGPQCSLRQLGIGANMAMRRSVFNRVGYFDELVGPGGIIPSGDDRDFLYRAARKGCQVLLTPEPEVVHYGYRSWEQDGQDHGRNNSIGLAVPYVKYMRQRDPVAFYRYLGDFLGDARKAAGRVVRWHRPLGVNRLRFFLSGATIGLRYPLDPETMVFRPRK